ncbi:hypothetical protein LY15_000012 [Prauserella flava]|uniref:Coenzyme PQQ synthesis protein A n=1 Tax=Prauserella sediminis TaxID=577680 RepID=A0A839XMB3_9PSEU|nr:hypothetical protein [Prauserella sediminis]MCR3718055.1 hypothetical protein [Prauserella flava]MCR3732612.1 hypothetical protein [Prauserella salsuginis]
MLVRAVTFRGGGLETGGSCCPVNGYAEYEEENMMWETPEYTVVEVCAEATGYFYRG